MSFEHANAVTSFNSIISGRIKVSDCSQVTDGAVTVFMASEKYAAKYAQRNNIILKEIPTVLGWGHTTAPLLFTEKISKSKSDPYILPLTRKAIEDAFKRADIRNCWELDAIETHDCFTTTEYMAIDHFGLTEPGMSWKAIEDRVVYLGGKLPINPSGGLIGCGHPVGATGARQILDAYKQVTNNAGAYQVEGAKKVATLNIGGTATTNVCFIIGFL